MAVNSHITCMFGIVQAIIKLLVIITAKITRLTVRLMDWSTSRYLFQLDILNQFPHQLKLKIIKYCNVRFPSHNILIAVIGYNNPVRKTIILYLMLKLNGIVAGQDLNWVKCNLEELGDAFYFILKCPTLSNLHLAIYKLTWIWQYYIQWSTVYMVLLKK